MIVFADTTGPAVGLLCILPMLVLAAACIRGVCRAATAKRYVLLFVKDGQLAYSVAGGLDDFGFAGPLRVALGHWQVEARPGALWLFPGGSDGPLCGGVLVCVNSATAALFRRQP